MSYVYKQSEPGIWTVGFYDPSGAWHPETDHSTTKEAAARVAYLCGGAPDLASAARGFVAYIKEYFSDDLHCDHAVNLCGCSLRGEISEIEDAIAKAEGRTL